MPLKLVRDNIVHMRVDAIVNAANAQLLPGGGVSGSIFQVAGDARMRAACQTLAPCAVGDAVLTPGFDLPARAVIHAVGPLWQGGEHGEEALLRACYRNALALVKAEAYESAAFPLLGTGALGYPREQAMQAAISEISAFLMENETLVYIVVYDMQSFRLSEKLFSDIETFIDDAYVRERYRLSHLREMPMGLTGECARRMHGGWRGIVAAPDASEIPLEEALRHVDEPFSIALLRLIDQQGRTDVEVYKRANIDRKLFSKIRSNAGYQPSKYTALALAVALELPLPEARSCWPVLGMPFPPRRRRM